MCIRDRNSGGRGRQISEFWSKSEFQDSQGYTEKPCLKKTKRKKERKEKKERKQKFKRHVAEKKLQETKFELLCKDLFSPKLKCKEFALLSTFLFSFFASPHICSYMGCIGT